jgi:DNA-binding transcriptional LysR family regulator
LAQAGSFTKAAEQLFFSRSHISKQLSQLEADLGVTLLIRTTRTQHLTPQGDAFYQRCQNSLNGIEHAIERVIESADTLAGRIKINSVGGYIGEEVIAPLVHDFMNQYPQINIELDFTSKRVDLIGGEFDFVFRMGALTDSALIARELTSIDSDTFVSPGYLAKHGVPKCPQELIDHRCITGSVRHWAFINNKTNDSLDIPIEGHLICKNGKIMVSAALAGNGIIRVPKLYCTKEIAAGLLQPLFSDWHIAAIPFYLVYVQDKRPPQRLSVFKEYVIQNFAKYMSASNP